jgi:hypothetical protein
VVEVTDKQFLLLGLAVFAGSALGGVAYHRWTCQQCRANAEAVAKASAEMAVND